MLNSGKRPTYHSRKRENQRFQGREEYTVPGEDAANIAHGEITFKEHLLC